MGSARRLEVSFPIDTEMAVRTVFDKFHEKLGYPKILESREKFPDYILEDRRGRIVRAEAKHYASGAKRYKKLAEKCDLIICWYDDWGECPVPCLELCKYVKANPTKEVIVVPIGRGRERQLDPEVEWQVIRKKHFYRLPFWGGPKYEAKYIAFYHRGIEYIAKLKLPYEKTTWGKIYREIYRLTKDERYKPEPEWENEPALKLKFGRLIKIRKIELKGPFRLWRYTTFEKLLTAKTVAELTEK